MLPTQPCLKHILSLEITAIEHEILFVRQDTSSPGRDAAGEDESPRFSAVQVGHSLPFASHVFVPDAFSSNRLPNACSFEAAALAEPLSVVLHAIRRSKLEAGERVLILGAGAVGLLAASLAKAQGATSTVVVDIEAARLDFAKENGWATGTHCLPKGPRVSGAEALEAAKQNWAGLQKDECVTSVEDLAEGFDAVFECTGVESCMQMAVFVSLKCLDIR